MAPRVVIVLEDEIHRIVFLKKHLPEGVEVFYFDNVRPFLRAVEENRDRLLLVVFDHDLGRVGPPLGPYQSTPNFVDGEGRTGTDAAWEVVSFSAPALVWSQNEVGRKRIARVLKDEGKSPWVEDVPFRPTSMLGDLIREMVEGGRPA